MVFQFQVFIFRFWSAYSLLCFRDLFIDGRLHEIERTVPAISRHLQFAGVCTIGTTMEKRMTHIRMIKRPRSNDAYSRFGNGSRRSNQSRTQRVTRTNKQNRRPDETFQLSPNFEAAVWFGEGQVDWSLAWIDSGKLRKTFPAELLLELPEFAANLMQLLADYDLPNDLRQDLAAMSEQLQLLKADPVPSVGNGNGPVSAAFTSQAA